ncbi:hypothetical protein [Brevundimonas sp. Root1423]|uniref:hypothetical protein n=1 Tax=Brevundimonas sp. Root1423 TaxID=1736462 RepID=UPI000A68E811|nr:hypothetical protein [Brevundimonas sp. Root1423]
MKTLDSTSSRRSFAAWMDSQNVHLTDLEASDQVNLVKELISPRHWWWHDDIGFNEEPIPIEMITLERATLMLTGWHVSGYESPTMKFACSSTGQKFAAGRHIKTAFDILKLRAGNVDNVRKIDRGFLSSKWYPCSFVDLQTARRTLRQANNSEQFLSEPIELLLRDCAFVADVMPTYAQLQAENATLREKLLQISTSSKAATVKRATRMLEALKELEGFAKVKWGARTYLLDVYEDEVVNDPRAAELKVPTRDELERWIIDRPSRSRAGS